jgi:hypothetical protein
LTEGAIDDNSGTSSSPLSFSRGSAGDVLHDIPYQAGDEFRLEVLQNDFVGVNFTVSAYPLREIDGGLLNISRSGNTITINWSGGTLQSADSLPASWTDVQGASSPYTVSATGSSKFFRLRQ